MPDVTPDEGRGPNIGGESSGYSRTPIPDPTILTTQALYREVSALRELIEQQVDSVAIRAQEARQALEKQMISAIQTRTELDIEKDRRTSQQFELVERQRVEQKKDTKDAVDAALTAQKEAVREQTSASERAIQKSETATLKQLDQISLTFKTDNDSTRRSIDEVKERMGEIERSARENVVTLAADLRRAIGDVDTKVNALTQQKSGGADQRGIIGWAVAAIVGLVAIASVIVDVATK